MGGATVAWVCSVALGPRHLRPSPAADAFKWTRHKDLLWGPPELPSAVSARTAKAFVSSVSSSKRAGWTNDQHRGAAERRPTLLASVNAETDAPRLLETETDVAGWFRRQARSYAELLEERRGPRLASVGGSWWQPPSPPSSSPDLLPRGRPPPASARPRRWPGRPTESAAGRGPRPCRRRAAAGLPPRPAFTTPVRCLLPVRGSSGGSGGRTAWEYLPGSGGRTAWAYCRNLMGY